MHNPYTIRPPSLAPAIIPPYCPSLAETGAEYIEQHMGVCIYLWISPDYSFWYFPSQIKGNQVYGYAWDVELGMWKKRSFMLSQIDSIL